MAYVLTAFLTLLVIAIARNFATPERQLRCKVTHRYAIGDDQFKREMSVLLGPAITPDNRIESLKNGDEIFPALLTAIRAATATISFETYIYWSGDIGTQVADALAERAQAGVAVHVLVDWAGSLKMDQALIDRLRRAGAHVERYRPLRWYNVGRLNNRTHRKLLVLDGVVAFTGGVGIADHWTGQAQDPNHWRDNHFRVEGPAAAQFPAAFNDNWIKTTGEVLNGPAYFPPSRARGDAKAHLFISSPAGGSESMHLMFLMTIAAAVRRLDQL